MRVVHALVGYLLFAAVLASMLFVINQAFDALERHRHRHAAEDTLFTTVVKVLDIGPM